MGSATGVNGENLSSSVTLGGETFKNVPGGTATWSFSNGNYVDQNNSVAITITQATATIVLVTFTMLAFTSISQTLYPTMVPVSKTPPPYNGIMYHWAGRTMDEASAGAAIDDVLAGYEIADDVPQERGVILDVIAG